MTTQDPIQGVRVFVPGIDLKARILSLIAKHREKEQRYRDQANDLEASGDYSRNQTNDPITGLRERQNHHNERASYFEFIAQYLAEDRQYELDQSDLRTLEITDKRI